MLVYFSNYTFGHAMSVVERMCLCTSVCFSCPPVPMCLLLTCSRTDYACLFSSLAALVQYASFGTIGL